jgi:hypothetical protein
VGRVLRLRLHDLEWREIEGEIVILDLESSSYMAINNTGRVIWKALTSGATRDQLVAELMGTFSVHEEVAERDVDEFLESLDEADLLEPE